MIVSIFNTRKLKKIAKKAVIQGDHQYNIIEYYAVLIKAAKDEFYEDNNITLKTFLEDCHS